MVDAMEVAHGAATFGDGHCRVTVSTGGKAVKTGRVNRTGFRARLESDAIVKTVEFRLLRFPPDIEGNPIGDGQRLLSAWSRQASGSVPVPSANLSIRGHGRAVEGAWLQPRFS